MTTRTYALIWVGLGGFHADIHPGPWRNLPGGGRSRDGGGYLSGYDLEPDAALAACMAHGTVPDGTPVIDKRDVLAAEGGVRLSLQSPMVSLDDERPDVTAEDIARWPLMQAAAVAPELAQGNAYVALGAAAIAGVVNVSNVSVDAYVAYWRRAGARIGTVQAGVIVWETPPADPQPSFPWSASP